MGSVCSDWKECVLLAIDLDLEAGQEAQDSIRPPPLPAVVQCLGTFLMAKKRINAGHRYGVIALKEAPELVLRPTEDVDQVKGCMQKLQACKRRLGPLEMGSLIRISREVESSELPRLHVRVLLVYMRSSCPPVWTTLCDGQLMVDALFIHDRPEEGVNCPQEVYNTLEDLLDPMAKRASHHAYIMETASTSPKKLFALMLNMLVHPRHRVPQDQKPPPVNLARLPYLGYKSVSPSSPPANHHRAASTDRVVITAHSGSRLATTPPPTPVPSPVPQAGLSRPAGHYSTRPPTLDMDMASLRIGQPLPGLSPVSPVAPVAPSTWDWGSAPVALHGQTLGAGSSRNTSLETPTLRPRGPSPDPVSLQTQPRMPSPGPLHVSPTYAGMTGTQGPWRSEGPMAYGVPVNPQSQGTTTRRPSGYSNVSGGASPRDGMS